jgi:hypothetical protein
MIRFPGAFPGNPRAAGDGKAPAKSRRLPFAPDPEGSRAHGKSQVAWGPRCLTPPRAPSQPPTSQAEGERAGMPRPSPSWPSSSCRRRREAVAAVACGPSRRSRGAARRPRLPQPWSTHASAAARQRTKGRHRRPLPELEEELESSATAKVDLRSRPGSTGPASRSVAREQERVGAARGGRSCRRAVRHRALEPHPPSAAALGRRGAPPEDKEGWAVPRQRRSRGEPPTPPRNSPRIDGTSVAARPQLATGEELRRTMNPLSAGPGRGRRGPAGRAGRHQGPSPRQGRRITPGGAPSTSSRPAAGAPSPP